LSESRDAGNPHVRFDERDLETESSLAPPRQISTLQLKIVLVLDLLGLCVETRPESSRTISLH
jgi:hypothetical protein